MDDKYPKVRKLEDPIQAHLRAMEDRNPSERNHKQGFLKNLADMLYFIDRALEYRKEFHIFKISPIKNEKDYRNLYFFNKLENIIIKENKENFYKEIMNDDILEKYKN